MVFTIKKHVILLRLGLKMKVTKKENKINIKRPLSLYLMTLIDGMVITYIYLFRSNNFVNMQTGNLIKFIVDLSRGVFTYYYLVYILSFFGGLMCGYFISKARRSNLINLGVQLALLIPSIFLPINGELNILSLALFSAFFGVQFGNYEFRKIEKMTVTTNMMTNNMRLFSQSLGEFIGGESDWKKPLFYFSFILSFCIGVSGLTLLSSVIGSLAIIVPICLLPIIFVLYL